MEKFYLSNSKMHDWETMCPLVWKAKHIDKTVKFEPTEDMEWGNYFETLVIGSSVGGRVFTFDDSPHGAKMKNSVYLERVKQQAKDCRTYIKALGGSILSRQEYIRGEVVDSEGQIIYIDGTLDLRYELPDGRRVVIDLKFTGDTENDFGKFAWGAPEKMDLSQIVHYGMLDHLKYGGDFPLTRYWVFDKGSDLKQKLLVAKAPEEHIDTISDFARFNHIERVSKAYHEITMAITLNDWTPINKFSNCRVCPVKCNMERVMPEETFVYL